MIQRLKGGYLINRARINRLSKEGSWIVIGQVASILGLLALVRVLTEYLDPAEYGQLALGMTLAGLINQVVTGGVVNGIIRFYSVAIEKRDLPGYVKATQRLLITSTLLIVLIGAILLGVLAVAGLYNWFFLALAVLIFSILSSYSSALNGIQNAARQRRITAFHGGMDAWLKIGLAVSAMWWLGANSAAVVLGYILSATIVNLSQLHFLKRLISKQQSSNANTVSENWSRQIWSFAWPFSTWGIVTWAQQVSDRWALESFATTTDVGQYVVVFQIGYAPIGILTSFMITLIGPILYHRSGGAMSEERNDSVHLIIWRITWACIVLTSMSFIGASLFHDWVFSWLVTEAFREKSFLLPWVVAAGGMFAAGQMLSLKLMAELRPHSLLSLKITTALLGVGANIIGARWFGLEGVVAALVFFSATYFAWSIVLARQLPKSESLIAT